MMTTKTNVDAAEIEKFNALASRWWDETSEFKPLHQINPLRLAYIEEKAGDLKGKRILDVGCGGGILSESLAKKGAEVMGIDMGKGPIEVARLHLHESQLDIDYQQRSVESLLDDYTQQFDIITCMEMIEHVPDPSSIVSACSKLLKPEGHCFFSTINRNPKSFLFAIVGAEYILNLLPKGTHEYAKFVKPSELSTWSRNAGLELFDMIGMHYNPITQIYTLKPGVDVNYIVHTRKVTA